MSRSISQPSNSEPGLLLHGHEVTKRDGISKTSMKLSTPPPAPTQDTLKQSYTHIQSTEDVLSGKDREGDGTNSPRTQCSLDLL